MGRQKHPGAHGALRERCWWWLLRTCRCEIGTCDELWPAAPSSVWFHRRVFDRVVHDENIRPRVRRDVAVDRKSTRLNSSHVAISYAVFCLKKNKTHNR